MQMRYSKSQTLQCTRSCSPTVTSGNAKSKGSKTLKTLCTHGLAACSPTLHMTAHAQRPHLRLRHAPLVLLP